MESMRFSHFMSRSLTLVAVVAFLFSAAWAASTTQVIYSFTGGTNGEYTDTELARDSAGNLYGTSVQGGVGAGTVFKVTPAGVHSVLYSFTGGADGGEPYKGVTLDAQGNLYGTAVTGGGGSCEGGCGVVFKLTHSGSTWTQSVIHAFGGGNDGSGPGSPVVFDAQGALYGTTPTGGFFGEGVVYRMQLNRFGKWEFAVIHAFTGGGGTGGSASHLLVDAAGNLYGTCTVCGRHGNGTVYRLSLVQGKWQFKTLYAFKNYPDGALPYGGVILDSAGNLYGTTYYAGENGLGIVYKLTNNNGVWTETVLYSFQNGSDGASPISTLVSDAKGNLYGTASAGGSGSCGCGAIFKLAPGAGGTWTESVLYSFPGAPSAAFAYNGMVSDSKGNFYGATTQGGRNDDGAIYKFVP